jgi:hypothetical protein
MEAVPLRMPPSHLSRNVSSRSGIVTSRSRIVSDKALVEVGPTRLDDMRYAGGAIEGVARPTGAEDPDASVRQG